MLGGTLYAAGQGETTQKATATRPIIAVSILPQSYFVDRIGGDTVQTLVLVGPGKSPHSYEPTPQQMQELSRASAWVLSNTDFEIALKPKVVSLYPSLRIVDGTDGVKFRSLEAHDHDEESAAPSEHQGKEVKKAEETDLYDMELDRHTWLGWENAKILAGHIRDLLTELLPEKHRSV